MTTIQAPRIEYLKSIPKRKVVEKKTEYQQIQDQLFDEPDWQVDQDKELRDENELRHEDRAIEKRSERENYYQSTK